MLKAWEAMRLGKDAQIAALMERCKRHEEDAGEKARTVEALRRKLAVVGRDGVVGAGASSVSSGSQAGAPHSHSHNQLVHSLSAQVRSMSMGGAPAMSMGGGTPAMSRGGGCRPCPWGGRPAPV